MLEQLFKNLWLLFTLAIPGLSTYGTWRAILLLEPSKRVGADTLVQIDGSTITTVCIVVAVAVLQQSVAIVFEVPASLLATCMKKKGKWPNFHALFHERFALASAGKLDENASRVMGGFFQSVNVSVGLALLLVYFLAYEPSYAPWVPIGLGLLLVATLTAAGFRMRNALCVIEQCKKDHHD